jgi:hypothetical protein
MNTQYMLTNVAQTPPNTNLKKTVDPPKQRASHDTHPFEHIVKLISFNARLSHI